jgi:ubiquinone biosynthesis protein UbiJ
MNNLRRLAMRALVLTLASVPALLAISVYAAIGVLAGVAGALAGAIELGHAAVSELMKRLPLGDAPSAQVMSPP